MAINFEAANMAGYNNPRIEVFRATLDYATNIISGAPNKTELIRCLNRGSIPAILCTSPDGSESSLLWVFTCSTVADVGNTLQFGTPALMIVYAPDSETPIVSTGG